MGVDYEIYIRLVEGCDLPNGEFIDGGEFWDAEEGGGSPLRATHGFSSGHRFYGKGHERGYWPEIAAFLLYLLAHPSVDLIWYCSDDNPPGDDETFSVEDLNEINRHYVAVGHGPNVSSVS